MLKISNFFRIKHLPLKQRWIDTFEGMHYTSKQGKVYLKLNLSLFNVTIIDSNALALTYISLHS